MAWYDRHARDLPWRKGHDPYAVMVSEFMLQQTQVKTVIPYFRRFLARFPDVRALAGAALDDVLSEWKGLGYYRRARMLHDAARAVVQRHGGRIPDDPRALSALPGVGRYTAAAIGSIAFRHPVPAVDGNVLRVMARMLDYPGAVDRAPARRMIAERLSALMPPARPGDFNQAMMELGATICTPSDPRCTSCPLAGECLAYARGTVARRPVRLPPKAPRSEARLVAVVFHGPSVLLVRRPDQGLLAGLWEFPSVAASEEDSEREAPRETAEHPAWGALRDVIEALSGRRVVKAEPKGRVEHRFSHLIWRMDVVRVELAACEFREGQKEKEGIRWVDRSQMAGEALPKAMQKVWEAACGPVQLRF